MAGSWLDFTSLEPKTSTAKAEAKVDKPKPERSRKVPPREMDPEMIPELRTLLVKYKPRSLTHAKAILKEAWDGISESDLPRKKSLYLEFVKKMNPKVAKKYRALKWSNKERMDHIGEMWSSGKTELSDTESEGKEKEASEFDDEIEEEETLEAEEGEEETLEAEEGEEAEESEEELPVLPLLPFKTNKTPKSSTLEIQEEPKKEKKEKKAKKEKKHKKEKKDKSKKRKFEETME